MRVERNADGWRATPPSWRFDIAIEEDLIEEVIRVHGYERVPTRAPRGELRVPPMPEAHLGADRFRSQLAARDYFEAICFAFLDETTLRHWKLDDGAVALANPLSAELGVMRTSLLPGLVSALASNRRRQQERVRLFEIGNVFASRHRAPIETAHIAGVASRPRVRRAVGGNAAAPGRFLRHQRRRGIAARAEPGRRTNSAGRRPTQHVAASRARRPICFVRNRRIGLRGRAASGSGQDPRRRCRHLRVRARSRGDFRAASADRGTPFPGTPRCAVISPSSCPKTCLMRGSKR